MRRAGAALVAGVLSIAAGSAVAGRSVEVCELRGADRARTPSTRCVVCHDGSVGTTIEFNMTPHRNGMSHPVEVDYAAAAARQPDHYAPPEQLPREVPLVAGRVACTSCHDGASPEPKRVVLPFGLCQACHRR